MSGIRGIERRRPLAVRDWREVLIRVVKLVREEEENRPMFWKMGSVRNAVVSLFELGKDGDMLKGLG